jgi:predicted dehydrogenase
MPETAEARRSFLKSIAAGAAASTLVQSAEAAPLKGEQLRIGLIGCGVRMGQLLKAIKKVRDEGLAVEIVAISEVFDRYESEALDTIEKMTGKRPATYRDYQDLLALDTVDAVMLGTPDHWHAKQSIDALKAGKHVYCEKPMTHTIDEAFAVLDTWRSTGRVMQVGVQTTSIPAWNAAKAMIDDGKLGKVLQYQTEYFRNSNTGQTRFRPLTEDMTPKSIDWKRWLGVDEGLLPDAPFDRAVFAHWRCYWPYGAGILTDLFVHRLTAMLKVTGLRYPGRVVCGGGIYLEYDERDTPDVTTVTVDYREGVQGILMATMCADATKIPQLVRGHFGSLVFPNGEDFGEFDFIPERPQVTLVRGVKEEHVNVGAPTDRVAAHVRNFFEAAIAGDPTKCNNTPEIGAAAVVTIQMSKDSYRNGKVYVFDPETRRVSEDDGSWARGWEKMSKEHAAAKHVPGWHAGDYGSTLRPPEYMKLAGPWIDGKAPEART